MKDIICAFDVDGVILNNGGKKDADAPAHKNILDMIRFFGSDKMPNVFVIVWSGNGKEYAEQVVKKWELESFISGIHTKWDYDVDAFGEIDIAFDDIPDFSQGDKNLIVKL